MKTTEPNTALLVVLKKHLGKMLSDSPCVQFHGLATSDQLEAKHGISREIVNDCMAIIHSYRENPDSTDKNVVWLSYTRWYVNVLVNEEVALGSLGVHSFSQQRYLDPHNRHDKQFIDP